MCVFAGPVSEERFTGRPTSDLHIGWQWQDASGQSDYAKIRMCVEALGLTGDIDPVLDNWELDARTLIDEHWHKVEDVAAALVEHGALTADEIRARLAQAGEA